jgi:hypothetical protein
MRYRVALFGEAERGHYKTPYHFKKLEQLADALGQPPPNTLGLLFAVQTLMFERELIYFRVKEEGFSIHDYQAGLRYLQSTEEPLTFSALCLPGVGDTEIIEASTPICHRHRSILILTEADLFDYLTSI